MPESPRYLELSGKPEEADALVGKMEQEAGIISTPDEGLHETQDQKTAKRMPFSDLWSRRFIKSTLVLWVNMVRHQFRLLRLRSMDPFSPDGTRFRNGQEFRVHFDYVPCAITRLLQRGVSRGKDRPKAGTGNLFPRHG